MFVIKNFKITFINFIYIFYFSFNIQLRKYSRCFFNCSSIAHLWLSYICASPISCIKYLGVYPVIFPIICKRNEYEAILNGTPKNISPDLCVSFASINPLETSTLNYTIT